MRDALTGAMVGVLRDTRQPGSLGFGSEQAPLSPRRRRIPGGLSRAEGLTVSAAGDAHQPRTHGLARAPGSSASDRRRRRATHDRRTIRRPSADAPPSRSRGHPRSTNRVDSRRPGTRYSPREPAPRGRSRRRPPRSPRVGGALKRKVAVGTNRKWRCSSTIESRARRCWIRSRRELLSGHLGAAEPAGCSLEHSTSVPARHARVGRHPHVLTRQHPRPAGV